MVVDPYSILHLFKTGSSAEIDLAQNSESDLSSLFLQQVHLPRVIGKVQVREDCRLGPFDVHEGFVHHLEFNGFRVILLVEGPEILDDTLPGWVLDAK